MTNSIPELAEADCILVTGSNTMEAHPLIATYILRAVEAGAKLIVVDPRDIPMARFATLHLRPTPGTDVAWLNGLMHIILAEGLEAKAFIAERTEGFEALAELLKGYTPEAVKGITGIPAADLIAAARLFGAAERGAILYAMGITQHTTGTENVLTCANLAMLTGNVGRPSTGVYPLRGQNNVQGACDAGCLVNTYPGYQTVTVPAVREKFEKAWGRTAGLSVGLTVNQMLEGALKGQVRAMYIMGENPMMSDPDIAHVHEALGALDFLAVSDIFISETADLADVILPAASWLERDGTFTATDRRVQRFHQAIAPLGESKPDWWIISEIAKRMVARLGQDSSAPYAGWDYASPQEINAELNALTPSYAGISYERLEKLGCLQWPCPSEEHPGTPYLHKGHFSRGLGAFSAIAYRPAAEPCDAEYPLILTTGRSMFHYHTGTMTRRTAKLVQEVPEGYIEVSAADADRLGIAKSERVRLISRRGAIEARAWITRRVPPGVVFAPFHFAEAAANTLTIGAFDPRSGIPEYKVCAVRLEPARAAACGEVAEAAPTAQEG
jgi:formate dehydrogenase alpha subunit